MCARKNASTEVAIQTASTDGLLILALIHELLMAGKIDTDYLARCTDAPCLLDSRPGAGHGLLLRDADGKLLVIDRASGAPAAFDAPGVLPDLGASGQNLAITWYTNDQGRQVVLTSATGGDDLDAGSTPIVLANTCPEPIQTGEASCSPSWRL